MGSLLVISEVSAAYGAIKALSDVSLEIRAGEIVTLIGANGAGKSTLLMTIFGQPRLAAGRIEFAGEDISLVETHQLASRGLSLVPEGRRIFGKMSVEENLLMGTIGRKVGDFKAEMDYVLDMFPRLKERRTQRAGTMSGGEQQMLAIGRSLMQKPKLLLLDEPSLGLAPIIVNEIFKKLREIAAAGTTIFLVEQNAKKALQLAERGYVLQNGEIKLAGPSAELLANPKVQELYLGHG